MKSKVMDRPLFKGPAVPDDQVENVGIMQGFMDNEDDLMSMLESDDDEEDMDEDESNQTMERSPRSPEILMNNLRGDMRSMDARVEELADLVGYNAAQETPEEVLMLLQPILAKQGIGGLPAAGAPPAMPPQGMPPPEMGMPPEGMPPAMAPAAPGAAGIEALMAPPAPPPTDQAPVQMKDGGYVQRFQAGSDEEGVTPMSYPPELVKYAQEQLMAQRGAGNLKQAVADVMPTYREILGGGDRTTMQGQALMDVAQAGLRLASGRNAQGANIAGGSFASQLASAAEGLPGKLSERAGQFQQEERAIKLAALKSAESNVDTQRKLYAQIVKSSGQSPFGKGLIGGALSVLNSPLLEKYAAGQTTPQENNIIETARLVLERPTTSSFTNDKGFIEEKTTPGIVLPHVTAAFQQRNKAAPAQGTRPPSGSTSTVVTPPAGDGTAVTIPNDPLIRDEEQANKRGKGDTPPAPPASIPTGTKLSDLPPEKQAQLRAAAPQLDQVIKPLDSASPTLWSAHKEAVGMHRQIGRVLGENIPFDIAGQLSARVSQATSAIDLTRQEIINSLRNSAKLAEGERKDLEGKTVKLGLEFFQNEAGYRNQVIALALDFDTRQREAMERAQDPRTDKKEKNFQENRAVELGSMISRIGAPKFVRSMDDYKNLPAGSPYLGWDQKNRSWVLRDK